MGLLKMFGVGGGELDVVLDQTQIQAGESLNGVAKFIGGKRDQEIDAITLSVNCTIYRTEQTPQGPQKRSDTQQIVPKTMLARNITSEAKGLIELPFSFPIAPTAYSSAPGLVEYRLHASADIDGEVDPGDSEVFTVVGGEQYEDAVRESGMATWAFRAGERIVAQWQDGEWYAGRVTNVAGDQVGVDWDEARLGATAWVHVDQVMSEADFQAAVDDEAEEAGGKSWAASGGKLGMLDQKTKAAAHAKLMAAKSAGVKYAPKTAPAKPGMPPKAVPAAAPAFKIGMAVMAQHSSGGWFPGKVVQTKDEWIGVDWDDAKLGQSSWVQAHQLKAR